MTMSIDRCPHGIDKSTCPACAQDQFDSHVAIQLASLDPEGVDRWRRDFEACLLDQDALRAYYGDAVPSVAPEVP